MRLIDTGFNYPSGYQVAIDVDESSAREFVLQPGGTLTTSDGRETGMVPAPYENAGAATSFVFFFPDLTAAQLQSGGQTWYELVCSNTTTSVLSCSADGLNIFSVQSTKINTETLAIANYTASSSIVLNIVAV